MKANELRIGNFVSQLYSFGCDGTKKPEWREWDLDLIDIQDVQARPEIYEPIPLTEEWLVRFGFVKYDQMGDNSFWNYSLPNQRGWNIAIFHDGIYVSFGSLNWDNCPIIQHVHQLQNLYFALTGEELALK